MKSNDISKTVSVIIPVYNVEKYLRDCVDSVLAQTYTDIEVILVDDGSPDNCGAICDEYAARDSRVKVIHKENGGQADARNAGLDIACGEYICFVDSDDYIKKETIGELLAFAEKKEADIVFFNSDIKYENEGHKIRPLYHDIDYDTSSGTEVFDIGIKTDDFFFAVWLDFFKSDFIRKEGLRFKKGIYYEDMLFSTIAFLHTERAFYLNKSFYCYRIRDNSTMTSSPKDRNFRSWLTCISEFRKEILHCSDNKKITALERCIIYAAGNYIEDYIRLDRRNRKIRTRDLKYLLAVMRQLKTLRCLHLELKFTFPELFVIYKKTLFKIKKPLSNVLKKKMRN